MAEINFKSIAKDFKGFALVDDFMKRSTRSVNWDNGSKFHIVDYGIAYFYDDEQGHLQSIVVKSKDTDEEKKVKKEQIDKIVKSDDFHNGIFCFVTDLYDKVLTLSQIARYRVSDAINPKTEESTEFELEGDLVALWREFEQKADGKQLDYIGKVLTDFKDKTFEVKRSKTYYHYDSNGRLRANSKPQFFVVD